MIHLVDRFVLFLFGGYFYEVVHHLFPAVWQQRIAKRYYQAMAEVAHAEPESVLQELVERIFWWCYFSNTPGTGIVIQVLGRWVDEEMYSTPAPLTVAEVRDRVQEIESMKAPKVITIKLTAEQCEDFVDFMTGETEEEFLERMAAIEVWSAEDERLRLASAKLQTSPLCRTQAVLTQLGELYKQFDALQSPAYDEYVEYLQWKEDMLLCDSQ